MPWPRLILAPISSWYRRETTRLSLGELKISDTSGNLTIQSTGGTATILGDGSSRVLEIDAPSNVAITGMAVTGGYLYGNTSTPQEGAGIYNSGILALTNVTVDGNNIVDTGGPGAGAGIENTGNLTVLNSAFTDNNISGGATNASWSGSVTGGGINNSGNATIADSIISGNSLQTTSAIFFGQVIPPAR